MSKRPNVVFVLGGPGAGKGTQCNLIIKEYGYVHLSAGDLLRAERKKPGSEVGSLIEKHIQDGSIVPVEITCGLLRQAMEDTMARDASIFKFLIDGFPRNQDNLDGWEREMGDKVNLLMVLFFDCTEDTCMRRCLSRGESGSGRSDDNLESLRKRIDVGSVHSIVTYNESTKPIVDHYRKLDIVHNIPADGTPEQVFAEVQRIFESVKQ